VLKEDKVSKVHKGLKVQMVQRVLKEVKVFKV